MGSQSYHSTPWHRPWWEENELWSQTGQDWDPPLYHLLVVWPWAYDFLNFFICMMRVTRMLGIMTEKSWHRVNLTKWQLFLLISNWRAFLYCPLWAVKAGLIWVCRVSTECLTLTLCIYFYADLLAPRQLHATCKTQPWHQPLASSVYIQTTKGS